MTTGDRRGRGSSLVVFLAMICWTGVVPASAQSARGEGQIGQRQTRDDAAPNIEPMDRIESRIPNRVQSRVRNRIDRFYDPQANATSPYVVAGDQARSTRRIRR